MRSYTVLAIPLTLALVLGTGATFAAPDQQAKGQQVIETPADLKWQSGPPSLPPGSEFVIVEGDPSKEAYFAFRLRLPDGYRIPPHWHPVFERVTVISGTFHLGHGDKYDAAKMEALPAGSYFAMPPQSRHFARAEGQTVVQLNSIGPWEINYVNPADDPRKTRQ